MDYKISVTKPRQRLISILHPSTKRPANAVKTYEQVVSSHGGAAGVEYILAIENSDLDSYKAAFIAAGWDASHLFLAGDYGNYVKAVNAAAAASTGDTLMVITDDLKLFPHWDNKLLEVVSDHDRWALKVHDGSSDWTMTCPIMDRVLYDELGYVYNPEYEHMFAGTDLAAVCELMGVTITRNDLAFAHTSSGIEKQTDDEEKFLTRAKNNFGLKGKLNNKQLLDWLKTKGVKA